VEWGRGRWRAVLAFLPRGPRVPSYATAIILWRGVSVSLFVTWLRCAKMAVCGGNSRGPRHMH